MTEALIVPSISELTAYLALQTCTFVAGLFVPGFLLLRRYDLTPIERLIGSYTVSILILATLLLAMDITGIETRWIYPYTIGCLLLLIVNWRALSCFLKDLEVRTAVATQICFFLLMLCSASVVTALAGGDWYGDWFAHYNRAHAFIHPAPEHAEPRRTFRQAERPPVCNLVAAYLLVHSSTSFPAYQIAMLLIGSLLPLAALLFLRGLGSARGRASAAVLLALLAFNPSVCWNQIYTWTRALSVFFVIAALGCFWSGLRDGRRDPVKIALVAMALSFLTHYTAIAFAVPFLVLCSVHAIKRRAHASWRDLVLAGVAVAPLGLLWFGGMIHRAGWRPTFRGNTFARELGGHGIAALPQAMINNLRGDLITPLLRDPRRRSVFAADPSLSRLWDELFYHFETTLPGMIGCAGLVGLLMLVLSARRKRPAWSTPSATLVWIVLSAVLLSSMLLPAGKGRGAAQIALQPVPVLVAAAVAGSHRSLSRRARVAVAGGALADMAFLGLHLWKQHVPLQYGVPGKVLIPLQPLTLFARANLRERAQRHIAFLGDSLWHLGPALGIALAAAACIALLRLARSSPEADPSG